MSRYKICRAYLFKKLGTAQSETRDLIHQDMTQVPIIYWIYVSIAYFNLVSCHLLYNESLTLRPLPNNNLLASFQFQIESLPFQNDNSYNNSQVSINSKHNTFFPSSLIHIIESTDTRKLQLRFTQGWWDSNSWGKLAYNGKVSGGTGVELWAIIEAPTLSAAKSKWNTLANSLSGFFCASLNFIDDSITNHPKYLSKDLSENYIIDEKNKLFLFKTALPSEPICTENLTPFLKLLPSRGKAGISSLLDGHKVFDSLWHSMSIDLETKCDNNSCALFLDQTVNTVIDVLRSIRKEREGHIPKPTPGEDLKCDESKVYNIWQCFPDNKVNEVSWNLATIFGRTIKGPALSTSPSPIKFDLDKNYWNITVSKDSVEHELELLENFTVFDLNKTGEYDFKFASSNSTLVKPMEAPPLHVSRSLTGYSQDQGGLRISFSNPSDSDVIKFVYFDSFPWFMRLYLSTLNLEIRDKNGHTISQDNGSHILEQYYKPAVDRKRPSHLELSITLLPQETMILSYEFDKSLLLYAEYPPDANHGFAIAPAIVTVHDEDENEVYELRTTSLLLSLPTPDFSMPYNVIILTCTVLSLIFGSVFNLLTKKTITEEEMENITKDGKLKKLIFTLKSKIKKS